MNADTETTLVGIFDDRIAAEQAVEELETAGFKRDLIGFAIRGSQDVSGGTITDAVGTKDGKGAVEGAVTGAVFGGALAAAIAFFIPGVGPILAGGIFASLLGGAAAGAATGGILGAMTGLGISEDEARRYDRQFNEGKAIVAVKAGAREADATFILRRHGGFDLHSEAHSPVNTTGPMSLP